ncbi:NAD(P)/FAD-dependent oxidoreductase [Sulfurovum sp. zt1-1]|uniref:NAD(P)/FAD-dependent oxidoreductase n=1 Tax=Sulfurovum zhangzhouensis TaxID=3019067 RepID=A0ABT7R0F7_9BACT|nr:NAD(P)/FAD-dependent oxidoreductase [Sulfurovum zhangzhouensis]MDM5272582.1 NAD(P)/FAD-dependent oxidoreductase [Sulfurovum zhangzhouensis]
MNNKPMIIVGAGAAGLCAAITAARNGINVTLLEQNSKPGKKILVSGNGKCNITNADISPARFHSQNPEFAEQVLEGYSLESVKKFFDSIGLPIIEGKEGKMFPMSLQAGTVTELLEYEADILDVEIITECEVLKIYRKNNQFLLETNQGTMQCEKLLLASGSPAAPQLGGNDSGLKFAESMGHTLIPTYPALTQLVSDEKWVKHASGVKMAGVAKLYANGECITEKKGDLLFTNYGISGLAILDLSREVSLRLADYEYCELSLDLMPQLNKEKLTNLLLNRIHQESQKPLTLWLQGVINKKLIHIILEQSKCKAKVEKELNRKEIGKLVYAIKNLKLSINDTKGFKGAEVATGGVDTREVDPVTMESKLVPNLYFAGEILDVDGDRGGFNFHFAWVSGMRAGENA